MAAAQEARDRADRIRRGADDLAKLGKEAWDKRDWEALNYRCWADYIKAEWGRNASIVRRLVHTELRARGMSERSISDETGVPNTTVHRDLSHPEPPPATFSPPSASPVEQTVDTESPTETESNQRPKTVISKDGRVRPATKPPQTSAKTRRAQVEQTVNNLTESTGRVPSGRDVARRLGLNDDRTVRKDWDSLYGQGKLPKRPEPTQKGVHLTEKQLERSEVTQELLQIRERVLRVSRTLDTINPEYKDAARDHWIKLASSLSQGVEDLIGKLTGDVWDTLLVDNEESK